MPIIINKANSKRDAKQTISAIAPYRFFHILIIPGLPRNFRVLPIFSISFLTAFDFQIKICSAISPSQKITGKIIPIILSEMSFIPMNTYDNSAKLDTNEQTIAVFVKCVNFKINCLIKSPRLYE